MAQRKRGGVAIALGILGCFGVAAGVLTAHFELVPAMTGSAVYAFGGLLGLLGVVAGFVGLLRGGGGRSGAGLLLAAIAFAALAVPALGGRGKPAINDITTNLDRPPVFLHAAELPANRGRDLSYPEAFRPIVRAAYPDLGPLQLPLRPAQALDLALVAARARPDWEITHVDRDRLVFEAVATTRIFRFRDDVVVRIEIANGGSRIDVRSKSRDGRGDLGANEERIRAFLADIREAAS